MVSVEVLLSLGSEIHVANCDEMPARHWPQFHLKFVRLFEEKAKHRNPSNLEEVESIAKEE